MKKILCALLYVVGSVALVPAALAADNKPVTPVKPDLAKGEALYTTGDNARNLPACASCHGPGGNSAGAANPKLAGQHAEYLLKQLKNFKPEKAGVKAARENAVMNTYAAVLTDAEMRDIAYYLQSVKLKPAIAKVPDSVALGQKIYRGGIAEKNVPACAACHGPAGHGLPAQYPRVQGQFGEYTEAQMIAFRQGTRKNGPMMMSIAARMSDAEIKAVSDYIAGLR